MAENQVTLYYDPRSVGRSVGRSAAPSVGRSFGFNLNNDLLYIFLLYVNNLFDY